MPSTQVLGSPNMSIEARVAALERVINSTASSVSLGKTRSIAVSNSMSGFSWAGDGVKLAYITTEGDIPVPPFASTVSIVAVVTSVVCSNVSANQTAFSIVSVAIPELGIDQNDGPNVFIESDKQQSRVRVCTVASAPVTGVKTLHIQGRGDASNTGPNVDNFLGIDAIAIFTY